MANRIVTESVPDRTKFGSVAFAFIVIIATAIIAIMFLYYKRRVKTLQTEIARVQYIADPLSATGKFTTFFISDQM